MKNRIANLTRFAGEWVLAPVVAVLFWIVIGVMIVIATAEGKDSPVTAFFTAFGAAGQVFLAFAVWRLSIRQFAFTQKVSNRQARIEAFELRERVFDLWLQFIKGAGHHANSEKLFALFHIEQRAQHVFDDSVNKPLQNYVSAYVTFVEATEDDEDAEKMVDVDPARHIATRKKRAESGRTARRLFPAVHEAFGKAMRVEGD